MLHDRRICGDCGHPVINHKPACPWPRCDCQEAIIRLTPRELDVLKLFAQGCRYKDAADRLKIAVNTVETHMVNVRHKLGMTTSLSAVLALVRAGQIPLDALPSCDLRVFVVKD